MNKSNTVTVLGEVLGKGSKKKSKITKSKKRKTSADIGEKSKKSSNKKSK